MGIRNSSLLAAGAALLGLGVFSGTVIGNDGSVGTSDRLGPLPNSSDAVVQLAQPAAAGASAAGKRRGKTKVRHGFGSRVEIMPGQSSAISLRCQRKFPVPLSAGLDTDSTGVVVNAIARDTRARSMLVVATNTSEATAQWTATIVCAKGVKEV